MKYIYFLVILFLISPYAEGQQRRGRDKMVNKFNKANKKDDLFLQKQWWIGLKGGINLSEARPDQQYLVVSPTNYDFSNIQKKYEDFREIASQASLEVTFYFKGISLSFQPTYRHTRFDYSSNYRWISNVENRLFEMNYQQEQKLQHIDFPLLAKYEIGGNKLRPYVQAGIFGSRLIDASKKVIVTKIDYASGGTNQINDDPIIVGATDLFAKNHWGLIGGAGLNYNLGNVRLNFDLQYRRGMSNISSTSNRYGSDRLAGVGDALDDLTLNTMSATLGCLFPMRFLESGFKSLDRK